MSYVKLDGTNVIFFGANYDHINIKNIYKAMNLVKPDCVLL